MGQGVVLRRVSDSRVRGNVFDGVGDGLVVDGTGHDTEVSGNVFLRASRWFIDAPDLVAGGNYWATPDAPARRREGPRSDQRAALEAGERGGLLASICDASACRSRRLNGFCARGTGRSGSGSGGSGWPVYVSTRRSTAAGEAAASAWTKSSVAPVVARASAMMRS